MRQIWVTRTTDGVFDPGAGGSGINVSVYAFRITGTTTAQAIFYAGDPAGSPPAPEVSRVNTVANGMAIDNLDGNGGHVECPGGCFVAMTGAGARASILVQKNEN